MQTSLATQAPDFKDALAELLSIVREIAMGGAPQRLAAVRYMACRDILLSSGSRDQLPGFLQQCVSIYKFQDFITLYHPKAAARLAFLEEAFGNRRIASPAKRSYDVFSDDDDVQCS